MKSDLNANSCQWKHMAKSLCDHIRDEKASGKSPQLSDNLAVLSVDEITEFAVYDCTSKQARKELNAKKSRKVFCNTPITLRIMLRNTLSVGLDIENIRLVCKFSGGEGDAAGNDDSTKYSQEPQSLFLDPLHSKEVVLRVVPLQSGDFEIERIEWELFQVVKCSRQLGPAPVEEGEAKKAADMSLKFRVIDASGECEAKIVLDGQDLEKDWRMIYSECRKGVLRIRNCSSQYKMKDAYVSCSHPLVFNFLNEHLFDELAPG